MQESRHASTQLDDLLRAEEGALDRAVSQLARESKEPAEFLMSVCHLLNRRAGYLAQLKEKIDISSQAGIDTVDVMDSKLVFAIERLLSGCNVVGSGGPGSAQCEKWLEKLAPLPEFPVAYMVLYGVRQRIDAVKGNMAGAPQEMVESIEGALVARLRTLVSHYKKTKTEPILRHLSAVQREYAVVARLTCSCGKTQHNVEFQALHIDGEGRHLDRLTVRCGACQKKTELSFALPHFGDLGKRDI